MLLSVDGHEVRVAFDGESALATLEKFRPDIALLDIGMPKMNGYELAARIRKEPWGRHRLAAGRAGVRAMTASVRSMPDLTRISSSRSTSWSCRRTAPRSPAVPGCESREKAERHVGMKLVLLLTRFTTRYHRLP
jgi:CheY-like chemotaxis protein